MRHIFFTSPFAAPAPIAPLALGMAVPAAARLLVTTPRGAQRLASRQGAAAPLAVLLAAVTARADENLASAPGTHKQARIVHRSSRRGGLDDPRSSGNTALGAVRQCGSGRSLGLGRPGLYGPGLRRPLRRRRSHCNPAATSSPENQAMLSPRPATSVPGANDPRPRRCAPRYPCPSGANDAREQRPTSSLPRSAPGDPQLPSGETPNAGLQENLLRANADGPD